jgi:hypothetical protein
MTRDDLKSCSGYTVEVMCDGKKELAELHDETSQRPFLTMGKEIAKMIDPIVFTEARPYYLLDDDIDGLSPNGPRNLFSRITLTTPSSDSN